MSVTRDDLDLLAVELRQTGALILHPCPPTCHKAHSIGAHIWDSTRALTDTHLRGTSYASARGGSRTERHDDGTVWPVPSNDSTGEAVLGRLDRPEKSPRAEYEERLTAARDATRALNGFLQKHRPDRWADLDVAVSDGDWCRNHLDVIGTCEPRYRGDLCQACYGFSLEHKIEPPAWMLTMRRDGKKWTQEICSRAVFEHKARQPKSRKGRKAS